MASSGQITRLLLPLSMLRPGAVALRHGGSSVRSHVYEPQAKDTGGATTPRLSSLDELSGSPIFERLIARDIELRKALKEQQQKQAGNRPLRSSILPVVVRADKHVSSM